MYLEIILDGVPTRAHVETGTEGVLLSTDRHLLKIDWQTLHRLYQAPSVKEEIDLIEINPKASPL